MIINKNIYHYIVICVMLWILFPISSNAQANKLQIIAPKNIISYQETMQLTTQTSAKTKSKTLWKSSDESCATVDEKGLVTGVGSGQTEITATCGKMTESITLTVVRYQFLESGQHDQVVVYANNKPRKYNIYSENFYNGTYGKISGCNVTSAAIVLSGMVDNTIDPEMVHQGEDKYSERYAILNFKRKYSDFDNISAEKRLKRLNHSYPTLVMLEEIFKNAGLKTKYVRNMTEESYSEAYDHLAQGNPIIFTTHRTKSYKGMKLARSWHTLVILGLDKEGKAIVANPKEGIVNYTHASHENIHLSVEEILRNFEQPCEEPTLLYSGDRFGYILISK